MKRLLLGLTLLFAGAAHGQGLNGSYVRLSPSTLPSVCRQGDLRVDNSTFALQICSGSNSWSPIGGGGSSSFLAPDGTVSAPGYAFANEHSSGMFRVGTGEVGIGVLSSQVLDFQLSSPGGFPNLGIGNAASASDLVIVSATRTNTAPIIEQLSNPSSAAGSGSKLEVVSNAGASFGVIGMFAPATTTPDAYAGGRMTVRASGTANGLSLIADNGGTAPNDVRIYSGGTSNASNLGLTVNQSLQSIFGGQTQAVDGLVGSPGISFANSTNSGFYRIGTNDFGYAINGVLGMEAVSSTGGPVNFGFGGIASTAVTLPVFVSRTNASAATAIQINNNSTAANSTAQILLATDSGNVEGLMGAYTAASTVPMYVSAFVVRSAISGHHLNLMGGENSGDDVSILTNGDFTTGGYSLTFPGDHSMEFMQAISTPTSPASGVLKAYQSTGNKFSTVNSSGTVSSFSGTNTGDQTITLSGAVTGSGTGAITTTYSTVPIASGGTGQTAQTAAFDALSPLTTAGDSLSYGSGHNIRIAAGALGLPYLSGGVSVPNSWAVLSVAGGGTGYTTLTSGSVLVGAGTTSPTLVAPGSSGNVLTSNGTTWVSSTAGAGSGTPYNFLVNGAFDYWQAITGGTVSNIGGGSPSGSYLYTADQWYINNILGGSTGAGVISSIQASGVTNGSIHGMEAYVSTAPTGTGIQNGLEIYQPLSNKASQPLYGQTASFTILVKGVTNVTQVGVQFYYATSETKLTTGIGSEVTCTVNNSTFSSCTINGQALGTSQTTSGIIGVRIRPTAVSSGHLYDINNGIILEQAMLNLGATAASFARQNQNPAQELAACQYFYEKTYDPTVLPGTASAQGYIYTATPQAAAVGTIATTWIYKTSKRIDPTLTFYAYDGTINKWTTNNATVDQAITSSGNGISSAEIVIGAVSLSLMYGHIVADARM